jgi:hypothetical protein
VNEGWAQADQNRLQAPAGLAGRRTPGRGHELLTGREREVLQLVPLGAGKRELAYTNPIARPITPVPNHRPSESSAANFAISGVYSLSMELALRKIV